MGAWGSVGKPGQSRVSLGKPRGGGDAEGGGDADREHSDDKWLVMMVVVITVEKKMM